MLLETVQQYVKENNQEHLLKYYNELNSEEKAHLLEQINQVDFSILKNYQKYKSLKKNDTIEPINVMKLNEIEQNKIHYVQIGLEAIRRNNVAAVLLAGGQGSRLGVSKSKGLINIGVTKELYIFECLINNLMQIVREAGVWISLYIMTSEINHNEITEFFDFHKYFGYKKEYITFFKQGTYPAIDFKGKILMKSKSELFLAPNGNGGWYKSMMAAGLTEKLKNSGIKYLNVFSIDNVLQRIADPCFVGAVLDKNFVSGAKVVRKAYPEENVGIVCFKNGKPSVIEYYELSDEVRMKKNKNGDLCYNMGVILNYLFCIDQLDKLLLYDTAIHMAAKKINYIDTEGNIIIPKVNNGYKFETLITDMMEYMDNCLVFEVEREKEFAPIKNKFGLDSIDTARKLLQKNGIFI